MTSAPPFLRRLLPIWAVGIFIVALASRTAAQAPPPPKPAAPAAPALMPQDQFVEADPIRCWWRTSAGAVRTGETFSLVLTCAVLDTEAVQVVPDEGRLGSNVIQMAPFEIVDGSHPADLHSPTRRFFQYDYVLRMINPDFIGHDVRVPDQTIHYRVNTKMVGDASIQGRDFSYILPAVTMKILSLVGTDAYDIRDGSTEGFATVEELTFRASMLRVIGGTLAALGVLVFVLSLSRLVSRTRTRTPVAEHLLGPGAVLALAGDELSAVQRESESGWNEALAGRALAASRIVAGFALGQPVSQAAAGGDAASGGGRLIRSRRRGKATAVWSHVTAGQLADRLKGRTPVPADRRPLVEQMRTVLAAFTSTQFTAAPTIDRASLDAAMNQSVDVLRTLKGEHSFARTLLRRWTRGEAATTDRS